MEKNEIIIYTTAVKSEFPTAWSIKIRAFWDVKPGTLVVI